MIFNCRCYSNYDCFFMKGANNLSIRPLLFHFADSSRACEYPLIRKIPSFITNDCSVTVRGFEPM